MHKGYVLRGCNNKNAYHIFKSQSYFIKCNCVKYSWRIKMFAEQEATKEEHQNNGLQ